MQLTIDGVRFDILDEGSGPAVVLLHGFPLAKETWDAQAAALSREARVVRFDLRGLGRSSVPAGPYLMESLAGDVAAVLDALRIERAAIVGHSLGGFVALAFYRMFTERCLGLGLVCTRATGDDAATAAARSELAQRAETEGMTPVVAAFLPRYFAAAAYREQPEMVARLRAIAERTDPRAAAAMLRGIAARVSSEDLLAGMDVPVWVLAGAHDAIVSAEEARTLAAGIEGSVVEILSAGHMPLYEAATALTESLQSLLRATSRR